MLELKNVCKDYPSGGEIVHALKGIDLQFRESEFVSILGPSGCGKTTMLNIIGGLDCCSSGDLEINGKSTFKFKDRDWDSYRNHSIGFVFQNYNLIPHQTVLSNVELALTLAGVSRKERRNRAKKALERVGLGDQVRKKPNQMSGGQMQRVAIARAIVNDPDIILADEPTGALDSETSLQVMEILKEISKDRLVIMVTHNPDLAYKYSTRIVNMLDGKITGDSNPLTPQEYENEKESCAQKGKKKQKMPRMKFHTAFGLSMKNLFTKRGRTILTCFAGSIGIIGIALIFSVSQGTNDYIQLVQEETLSSYPIELEAQTMDMSSLLSTFIGNAESVGEHENDAVYQKSMIYSFINSLTSITEHKNDLESFRNFLESSRKDPESLLGQAVTGVHYSYNVDLNVFTENIDGNIIKSDLQELMANMISSSVGMNSEAIAQMTTMSTMYSPMGSSIENYYKMWQELLPGEDGKAVSDILPKQYDIIYGRWPEDYDEVVLFVDANNEINDLSLYALGLKTEDEISNLLQAAQKQEAVKYENKKWTYDEICGLQFTAVIPSWCYSYDEETGIYEDLRLSEEGRRQLYNNGLKLKVVGIARSVEGSISTMIYGSVGYTTKLTEYMINSAYNSDSVKAQEDSPDTDLFTGLLFPEAAAGLSTREKAFEFAQYVGSLNDRAKADLYMKTIGAPSEEEIQAKVDEALANITRDDIKGMIMASMSGQLGGMDPKMVLMYIDAMTDDELFELFNKYASTEVKNQYAESLRDSFSDLDDSELALRFEQHMAECNTDTLAGYFDSFAKISSSSLEENLEKLGCLDLGIPSSINLYASVFKDKAVIEKEIEKYNQGVPELQQIKYTDYVGLLMGSVTTIIKAVTYVLVAFVAVSLIVSSIMIGVITLISVQERTKEIGVLRSLGASKPNVSSMFNAETVIIGLASGFIGVGVSYALLIPINKFLLIKTQLPDLKAFLPLQIAGILVVISVVLTLIAGIIPSGSAARKNPVEALRTE